MMELKNVNWKLMFIGLGVVALLAGLWYVSKNGVDGFKDSNEAAFTMYYADWCGHCKTAKPGFEEMMKSGPITVNGKTCKLQMVSPEKEPEKAKGKPIRGFPTFLMELPGGKAVEYRGERSTQGYLEFINKQLGGAEGDVTGDKENSV